MTDFDELRLDQEAQKAEHHDTPANDSPDPLPDELRSGLQTQQLPTRGTSP